MFFCAPLLWRSSTGLKRPGDIMGGSRIRRTIPKSGRGVAFERVFGIVVEGKKVSRPYALYIIRFGDGGSRDECQESSAEIGGYSSRGSRLGVYALHLPYQQQGEAHEG